MLSRLLVCAAACVALGLPGCKGATLPATNITSTGAKLNLQGEADRGPAFTYFEYWQTAVPSLKSTTVVRNWPAGAKGDFGDRANGLRQGTSYTFRACGNDTGKPATCLNTRSFTTGTSGFSGIAHTCPGAKLCVDGAVVGGGGPARDPSWSPDATKIAYAQSGKLWVLNVGSGSSAQLGTESIGGHPEWSPDGTRIAVDNGIIRASDGARLTTANTPNPSWSPTGTKLAYECPQAVEGTQQDDICVDGHQLTNTPGNDREPAWSPNGTKIAFASDRLGGYRSRVFVMNADGTNQTQVTFGSEDGPQGSLHDWSPSWSPSGTQIAFVRLTVRDPPQLLFGLNVVDGGGGTPRIVFEAPYPGGPNSPDWSPRP